MRTLKYRIYDEKKNVWVKDLIQFYAGDALVKQGHIIQDYTGLKDKNGKDIYEGDYVNFCTNDTVCLGDKDINEWKNQVVHYDEEKACFFFGYKYEFQILDKIMPETLEVVGNIFDNPDLIEQ